jgi:RimJ/RimL family protein N-acetyltransferase
MIIYGEKILLRAIEPDDNHMLLELINDPETEAMIGGFSWPTSLDGQMKWYSRLENSQSILRCTIADKEENKPLGTLILNEIDQKNGTAHIHIKMSKDGGRGKGYGTDALNTIVSYAFSELRLNCIFANIISYNDASVHLFEKCGFKRDGILRQRVFKQGKYHDVYTYSRLMTD